MSTYLSKEVQAGLDAARREALLKKTRLRVEAGAESWRILRMWEGGFALDADTAPQLRGLVDVYDGARHVLQALIVASDTEGDELLCEFKRATPHAESAPLDFAPDDEAPVALIGKA